MNPPDNAVMLIMHEKPPLQDLVRTAPILPLLPGTQRQTHDGGDHGTTTLFIAFDVATDRVTKQARPRHRH